MTSQVPPAPKDVPTDSRPETGREKDVEAPQGKNKSKDKGKDKVSDTTISLPEQAADPGASKAKVQSSNCCNIFISFQLFLYPFFLYYTFDINENMFLLLHSVINNGKLF